MRIFLIILILVGLIVFTFVQCKQLILAIKERKKSKTADCSKSSLKQTQAQEKDKISK